MKTKKENFLLKLKGTKLKYKRYTKQPLRYAGGKSLAVGEIIEYIPEGVKRVISPFCGGLSVEYALANELGIEVLCFDILEPLINFYQILKNYKSQLIHRLKTYELSEINYAIVRERLREQWEVSSFDRIAYAADFFFNFDLSYGPSFLGWPAKKYFQEEEYIKRLKKLNQTNFENLEFMTESFETVLPRYSEEFLYLDPPYFLGGTSKMFTGLYPQRNFPIYHEGFKHDLLAAMLSGHKGGFILTYNDCQEVRELYTGWGCEIIEKKWQYSMGNGETRIGKNRQETNIKESHEIFIIKNPV